MIAAAITEHRGKEKRKKLNTWTVTWVARTAASPAVASRATKLYNVRMLFWISAISTILLQWS